MRQQIVEPFAFRRGALLSQGLVAHRDKARDVAIPGFDDVLGGAALFILLAQAKTEGMAGVGRVKLIPGRSADQGDRVFGRLLRIQTRRTGDGE